MVSFPVISGHTRPIAFVAALCCALAAFLLIAAPNRPTSAASERADADVDMEARAIAASGRDTDGRLLPLYVHVRDADWLQPMPVYPAALVAAVAPATASPERIAAAAVAALDVALMFIVCARIFRSDGLACAAAALLMLTPAHALGGRLPPGALYPVLFVLAWLSCLAMFLDGSAGEGALVAGGVCLGCGFYADETAVLMMPVYLALTWLAIFLSGHRSARLYLAAGAGFVLPLVLHVPWFAWHPSTYLDTLGRWGVHPAYIRNPMEGVRAAVNWPSLSGRVWLFWDFFNPVYLFGTVLLLPLVVLIPAGVYASLHSTRQRPLAVVLALGLASAPLVAATFNERRAVARELVLLPFAIIAATYGVQFMLSRPRAIWRAAAVALLVAAPIHFALVMR